MDGRCRCRTHVRPALDPARRVAPCRSRHAHRTMRERQRRLRWRPRRVEQYVDARFGGRRLQILSFKDRWPGTARPSQLSIRLSPSAFDEDRSGALRALAFAHDAKALGHFSIGLQKAAEIAAEAVFVELVVGLDVPKPAAVGRNLVCDDNAHHVVFPEPAGLNLEVDEANATTG